MKSIALALVVTMFTYPIAPRVMAQEASSHQGLSDQERQDFAAREAQDPDLASFEAGDAVGLLVTVLVIVALVALIWWLIDYHHHYSTRPAAQPT